MTANPTSLQDLAKQLMDRYDWPAAAAVLERDVAENPSDPWSRMYLGSCQYELRNYETALEHFRIAERLAPGNSTPVGLQGDVFRATGDRLKAGELYRRALAMNPDDELAQSNMSWWKSDSEKRGVIG
jgi:tetratricopeptide (TPR) repeat protein